MRRRLGRFLLFALLAIPFGYNNCYAINIVWQDRGNTYASTSCTDGGNIILPPMPVRRGYTFAGWKLNTYQQLEYIQSDGNQYIDTGIYLTPAYKIESVWYATKDTENYALYGANNGTRYVNGGWELFWYDNRIESVTPTSNEASGVNPGINDIWHKNTEYHVIDTFSDFTVNDVNYKKQPVMYNDYVGKRTVYVFATNRGDSTWYSQNVINKAFKIYHNETLVLNLVPVRRISDDEIGMYDTVTATFFSNQGPGKFIAGPTTGAILSDQ